MTDSFFEILRKIAKKTGISLDFLVEISEVRDLKASDYLEENESSISGDRSRSRFKNKKSRLVP